jgi:hypothetical protein
MKLKSGSFLFRHQELHGKRIVRSLLDQQRTQFFHVDCHVAGLTSVLASISC